MTAYAEAKTILHDLLGDGRGSFWVPCRWCVNQGSPTVSHDTPDALRLLARAKALGWSVSRLPDGLHVLTCPRCARTRGA